MTDWSAYDPRRLAETLDALETVRSMIEGCRKSVTRQLEREPEATGDILVHLTEAEGDAIITMDRIQEAIDQSPEGREAYRREQPRRGIL